MTEGTPISEEELKPTSGFISKISERFGSFGQDVETASKDIAKRLTPEFVIRSARKEVKENYLFIKEHYGIDVDMGRAFEDKDPSIQESHKLNLTEARIALKGLRRELLLYPEAYIESTGVKKIRLLKDITLFPNGGNQEARVVGGFFDPDTKDVYLAVRYIDNLYKQIGPDFREAIHHELYHAAEYAGTESNTNDQDATINYLNQNWAKLNPQGEGVYLRDQFKHGDRDGFGLTPGFARKYGQCNEGEDRATIASLLMVFPVLMKELIQKDPVLKKKMYTIMDDFWYRSGCAMGNRWLENHLAGKTDRKYFESKHA